MNQSVRSALIGLWFLLLAICLGLGFFLIELYQRSGDTQVKQVEFLVRRAGESVEHRYATYLVNADSAETPANKSSEIRELNLVLSLVLAQFEGVEGGFWTPEEGFISYAFPTYGGADVKKDLPHSELKTIGLLAATALKSNAPQLEHIAREHRSLVLYAHPVNVMGEKAVIWTMGWANSSDSSLFSQVIAALAFLFFCSLISGLWLASFLYQWSLKVKQLEQAISGVTIEQLPPLAMTGQVELDRVVSALNQLSQKLKESQAASAQLSKDLARADKLSALGRMVAGFAHEIRNPLATISLSAENALEASSDKKDRLIRGILQEANALEGLLQKLLAVAKLNELKPKEINLRAWLQERIDYSQPQAEKMGLSLKGEAPDRNWSFDEESFSRAFTNLLLNALQNTPRGGWVNATVSILGEKSLFIVEDSGPGVPADQREMIFEPLFSGRADGAGIGLTIVREVAEAHGGSACCTQGAAGARFEMEIPWLKS